MYKRILVATDGSALSNKAVETGLSLAALSGATVVAWAVSPAISVSARSVTGP